jgi:hypothetical protein
VVKRAVAEQAVEVFHLILIYLVARKIFALSVLKKTV